jgi:hypothetical protein
MPIKPGHYVARPPGVANYNYAGFDDSMAERIEAELNALLVLDGLPALPMNTTDPNVREEIRDRRRLFVAIARGVVIHLRERHESLTVPHTGDPTLVVEINTEES